MIICGCEGSDVCVFGFGLLERRRRRRRRERTRTLVGLLAWHCLASLDFRSIVSITIPIRGSRPIYAFDASLLSKNNGGPCGVNLNFARGIRSVGVNRVRAAPRGARHLLLASFCLAQSGLRHTITIEIRRSLALLVNPNSSLTNPINPFDFLQRLPSRSNSNLTSSSSVGSSTRGGQERQRGGSSGFGGGARGRVLIKVAGGRRVLRARTSCLSSPPPPPKTRLAGFAAPARALGRLFFSGEEGGDFWLSVDRKICSRRRGGSTDSAGVRVARGLGVPIDRNPPIDTDAYTHSHDPHHTTAGKGSAGVTGCAHCYRCRCEERRRGQE